MRSLFLGSVLQDDHITRQPPMLSYMSYRWYKVERKITKHSHGVRKLNNIEDGSKWKSEGSLLIAQG